MAQKSEPNKRSTDYKLRILLKGNKAEITSKWMSNVTLSLGGAKLEQTWYDWEYAKSRGNVQHTIWEDIMSFISATHPISLAYEK